MTPPPPTPRFLDRGPGSDAEVRAWVAAAQATVAALHDSLLAATARAEHAEARLAQLRRDADDGQFGERRDADHGPFGEAGSGPGQITSGAALAKAHASFQSATDAAATVMAEARAILREARMGLESQDPPGQYQPALETPPRTVPVRSPVDPEPWGPQDWAPAADPPTAPLPAPPPAPLAAPGFATPPAAAPSMATDRPTGVQPTPGSAPATQERPDAAPATRRDRAGPVRPPDLGYDPSVVQPPRAPARRSKPGLGTLFGRLRRP